MRRWRHSLETALIVLVVVAVASAALLVVKWLNLPEDLDEVAAFFVQTTVISIVLTWAIEMRDEYRWREPRRRERRSIVARAAYLANGTYPSSHWDDDALAAETITNIELAADAFGRNAGLIDRAMVDPLASNEVFFAVLELSRLGAQLRELDGLAAFVAEDIRRLGDARRQPDLANAVHEVVMRRDDLVAQIAQTNSFVDHRLAEAPGDDPYLRVIAFLNTHVHDASAEARERIDAPLRSIATEARAMRDFLKALLGVLRGV